MTGGSYKICQSAIVLIGDENLVNILEEQREKMEKDIIKKISNGKKGSKAEICGSRLIKASQVLLFTSNTRCKSTQFKANDKNYSM